MRLIAYKMLMRSPFRAWLTIFGVGASFFLSAAQVGLLVGWCNTNSAIVAHSGADVWIMAKKNPAFDYGTPVPRSTVYLARSLAEVSSAEAMFMGWNVWQCGDGRRINVEIVGLDEGCCGGPWAMTAGTVDVVKQADTVIVDEMYLSQLGIRSIGDELEIMGLRARVGGISKHVRTFTAAPFVFTSIGSAIRYDKRYRSDEVTYVLAQCANGISRLQLKRALSAALPEFDVLTTAEFILRTVRYWMLETGVGTTVVITAVLGLSIGTIITSQTLFAVTQQHLPDYGVLLALGFSQRTLIKIILLQALTLGAIGTIIGTGLFFLASALTRSTPVALETTPTVFLTLLAFSLSTSAAASLISVRSIFRIDPISVFR